MSMALKIPNGRRSAIMARPRDDFPGRAARCRRECRCTGQGGRKSSSNSTRWGRAGLELVIRLYSIEAATEILGFRIGFRSERHGPRQTTMRGEQAAAYADGQIGLPTDA
jgi:hypothetical protein